MFLYKKPTIGSPSPNPGLSDIQGKTLPGESCLMPSSNPPLLSNIRKINMISTLNPGFYEVASPERGERRAGGVSEDEVRASASGSCAHCYEGPCVSFHLTTL